MRLASYRRRAGRTSWPMRKTSRRSSRLWRKRFVRVTLWLTTLKTATANATNFASRPRALAYRSAQVEQVTPRPRNDARAYNRESPLVNELKFSSGVDPGRGFFMSCREQFRLIVVIAL